MVPPTTEVHSAVSTSTENIAQIVTIIVACVSSIWAVFREFQRRKEHAEKKDADYIKVAFGGYDDLVKRLQEERDALRKEVESLRKWQNILVEWFRIYGIPLPDGKNEKNEH